MNEKRKLGGNNTCLLSLLSPCAPLPASFVLACSSGARNEDRNESDTDPVCSAIERTVVCWC